MRGWMRSSGASVGSIYQRGDSKLLWIAFNDATGRRRLISSKTENRAAAEMMLVKIERRVAAERVSGITGPLTVKAYAEKWIADRRQRGIASVDDDETRLGHALKRLGALVLKDVRPQHVRDMVRGLESAKQLAPRSILHVYGVLRVMFSDAVLEELVPSSPCVLKQRRGELPKKRDKNPEWRSSAVYTRDEVERLISDERISERKRVLYALEFLCGVRVNEVTPRRWRDYDASAQPLGRLTFSTSYNLKRKLVKAPKTGQAREVPVHPTLARVLAHWRLSGWAAEYGRAPTADDLIIPAPGAADRFMSSTSELKRMHESLTKLGLRQRGQHDARSTFITLGTADGGLPDVLEMVTHTKGSDVQSGYRRYQWPVICAEVAKLNIRLLEGRVLPLAATGSATAVLRRPEGPEMTGTNTVEAAGIELAAFGSREFPSSPSGGVSIESSTRCVDSSPEDTLRRSKRSSAIGDYEARGLALGFRILPALALLLALVGCEVAPSVALPAPPPQESVGTPLSMGTRLHVIHRAGATCFVVTSASRGEGPAIHCLPDSTLSFGGAQ
jgi:integrase